MTPVCPVCGLDYDIRCGRTACPMPLSDDLKEALKALWAISEGYPAKGTGHGFIDVENPDYRPDDGSNPRLLIDAAQIRTALKGVAR